MPVRVLIAGGEAAGARALALVRRSNHDVIAVAAARNSTLAARAEADGVEVLDPALVADPSFAWWVTAKSIDVLINVHALHLVVPQVLASLTVGGFNLHPGPLPTYAGLNAPSWAIVNDEARHATTLHRMDAGIDSGAIVSEAWFDLDNSATGLSVSSRCARLGLELLQDLLDKLDAGDELPSIPTTGRRRLYRAGDRPFGGRLPLAESAEVIDRVVRACAYHPMPSPIGSPAATSSRHSFGVLAGDRVQVDAEPAPPGHVLSLTDEGGAVVAAGTGHYRIDRAAVDGAVCSAAEILREGDQLI